MAEELGSEELAERPQDAELYEMRRQMQEQAVQMHQMQQWLQQQHRQQQPARQPQPSNADNEAWNRRFYENPVETFHALAQTYEQRVEQALQEQRESILAQQRAAEGNRDWWGRFYAAHPEYRGMEDYLAFEADRMTELRQLSGDAGRAALAKRIQQKFPGLQPGNQGGRPIPSRGQTAAPGGRQIGRTLQQADEDEDEDGPREGSYHIIREMQQRILAARRKSGVIEGQTRQRG